MRAVQGLYLPGRRELTSPSIATLMDILESLGTNIKDFLTNRLMTNCV